MSMFFLMEGSFLIPLSLKRGNPLQNRNHWVILSLWRSWFHVWDAGASTEWKVRSIGRSEFDLSFFLCRLLVFDRKRDTLREMIAGLYTPNGIVVHRGKVLLAEMGTARILKLVPLKRQRSKISLILLFPDSLPQPIPCLSTWTIFPDSLIIWENRETVSTLYLSLHYKPTLYFRFKDWRILYRWINLFIWITF